MDIKTFLDAGFTYEELYQKGILVPKESPAPAPAQETTPEAVPEPTPEAAPEPEPNKQSAQEPPAQDAVLSAINTLASEIKTALQAINRQSAERGQEPAQQMTIDDAITGLFKGV